MMKTMFSCFTGDLSIAYTAMQSNDMNEVVWAVEILFHESYAIGFEEEEFKNIFWYILMSKIMISCF